MHLLVTFALEELDGIYSVKCLSINLDDGFVVKEGRLVLEDDVYECVNIYNASIYSNG